MAACTSNSPSTGDTVTCTGTDNTGVTGSAGVNNVTVNVGSGASVTSATQGVLLNGTGWSINNQGTLSGSSYGISASGGSVGAVTIVNSGTLSATTNYAINLGAGGTITNNAGATIQGGTQGIVTFGPGTVYNYGTINGGTTYGIHYTAGGTITNYAGGAITSNGYGLLLDGGSAGTNSLTNSGTIAGGTSAGAYLSVGGTVTNTSTGTISGANGLLLVGGTATVTNNGSIAGSIGYGISIAAGSGGTFVNNGTISGATNSIQSAATSSIALTNNGTLTGNVVLGSGNDSVTLNAGSTLTGTLGGGAGTNTLTLGAGSSATGTITGNVTNVQSLFVNAPSTRWIINSGVAVSGNAEIQAGTLSVNGSLPGAVLIDSGATLGGVGTVGTTTVNGTLAPGNSIGAISVAGNLAFNPAGTYLVEVSPTTADRTNVTGTAGLSGTLDAAPSAGTYTVGKTYTILSATSGRSGTFSTFNILGSFGAGINAEVLYTATDAQIYLAPGAITPFLPAGTSDNGRAVAGAVDSALARGNGQTAFLPLFSMSSQQLPLGLAALSGEIASAGPVAGLDAMSGVLSQSAEWSQDQSAGGNCATSDTPWHRPQPGLSGCDEHAWVVRGAAFGGDRKVDGDDSVGSHQRDQQTWGATVAAERRPSADLRFGATLTGFTTHSNLSDGLGSDDTSGAILGVYGTRWFNNFYASGTIAGIWQAGSSDRQLTPLGVSGSLTGDHTGYGFGGRLELGQRFEMSRAWVTPFAAVQYALLHTPSYTESGTSGAAAYALSFGTRDTNAGRTEFGVAFGTNGPTVPGRLQMQARLAWGHAIAHDSDFNASLNMIPSNSFTINGAKAQPDSLIASPSITLPISNTAAFTLRGLTEIAGNVSSYAGVLSFRSMW